MEERYDLIKLLKEAEEDETADLSQKKQMSQAEIQKLLRAKQKKNKGHDN